MASSPTTYFDRVFDSVADCFTPEVAQNIADLRADDQLNARLDDLARRANDGRLTPEEDIEYKRYIDAIDVLAIIQAKARAFLARHSKT